MKENKVTMQITTSSTTCFKNGEVISMNGNKKAIVIKSSPAKYSYKVTLKPLSKWKFIRFFQVWFVRLVYCAGVVFCLCCGAFLICNYKL